MRKRTKRSQNGLAIVRRATDLSQQQFAERLGITKATIENIELNRAPLSPELQETISVLTGVVPGTLVSDSGKPRPLDFNQKPYCRESWQAWRQTKIRYEDTEMLHEMSMGYLNVLLKAAYETSDGRQTPHTFRSVLMNFNRFIFREIKRQNLAERINRLFATHIAPPPEFGETTVRWCRSEFGDHPEWKHHARPGWKDLDKVTFKSQFSPEYVPFIGFANIEGGPAFVSGLRSGLTIFDLEIGDQKFRVAKRKVSFNGFLGTRPKVHQRRQRSSQRNREI